MVKYLDVLKLPGCISIEARYCIPEWEDIVKELSEKN